MNYQKMINKEEWIKLEEDALEGIQNDLDKYGRKWFKTSKTYEMIKFLKKYLTLKEKFIEDLK